MKFIKLFITILYHPQMCNCNKSPIPSVYCMACKELLCPKCDTEYFKCSSCYYFSCTKCTIKLLCNHNYCSLQCIIENDKHTCDKKCLLIRDIVATDNKTHGLKSLFDHWINTELFGDNHLFKEWLTSILNFNHNIDKDNQSKIQQLLLL